MKSLFRCLLYLASFSSVSIFIGCSGDEDAILPALTPTLSVNDFSTTIDENPSTGQRLGSISVNTNQSNVSYNITDEDPVGALSVNSASGELSVADPSLFDFEINSTISATVEVAAGTLMESAEITITLRDLDECNIDDLMLTDDQSEAISYFKDIALGFEFGDASDVTRRWEQNMKIFVGGSPRNRLIEDLEEIVNEVNALVTTGFKMEIVTDSASSNYYIYFGTGAEYANLFPTDVGDLYQNNFGLFVLFYNGSNQFTRGHMYVDMERATNREQRHLLREELTQSLGLAKDSPKYLESIFQQSFSTTVVNYLNIDKELIRLLYHPDMSTGLDEDAVDTVLKRIYLCP